MIKSVGMPSENCDLREDLYNLPDSEPWLLADHHRRGREESRERVGLLNLHSSLPVRLDIFLGSPELEIGWDIRVDRREVHCCGSCI